jgi:DNA-binding response OmpR family regulator
MLCRESYASEIGFMSYVPRPPRITPVTPLFLNIPADSVRPRVLIVDDQDTVRVAIASLLSKRGCDVVTAESGQAALARVRAEYFDVLLCDVRMPGMSGLELLSEALLLDNDLPVLMLSGAGDMATARDALARGAMDYLRKPIELDELDEAIRSATRHRRHGIERQRAERLAASSAEQRMETLELHGGPLDGRRVRLEDRRFKLWVVIKQDGEHVWAAVSMPAELPADTRLLGSYGLTSAGTGMNWTPESGA